MLDQLIWVMQYTALLALVVLPLAYLVGRGGRRGK